MTIKSILFDLDGTLLPMDLKTFQVTSGTLFAKKMEQYGYDFENLMKASWDATMAMAANDGSRTNEEVYFSKMVEIYGEGIKADFPKFYDYYAGEFDHVKDVCGFNPEAGPAVKRLKEQGYRLVLATNSWFPKSALEARLRWAGVDAEDFEFMTTFDKSCFCKPKLAYYEEILQRLQLPAEECLMVGNDVQEDMVAAELGIHVFLMTDDLINRDGRDISQLPQGGFEELTGHIERYR